MNVQAPVQPPRIWGSEVMIVDGKHEGDALVDSIKDEYFKGYTESYHDRQWNSGGCNSTRFVRMYYNENNEWVGTIVFTEVHEAATEVRYTIPSGGPSGGHKVYQYFSGKLKRVDIMVSLAPRHPKF
jgi:hypothetical protein